MLNILVRQILDNMGLNQLGRAYFNPREKKEVHNLNIEGTLIFARTLQLPVWPGFKTAVGSVADKLDVDGGARSLTTLCVWQITDYI